MFVINGNVYADNGTLLSPAEPDVVIDAGHPRANSSETRKALQYAIDSAYSGGLGAVTTVKLRGETYPVDQALIMRTGVTLEGHYHRSQLFLANASETNVIQTASFGIGGQLDNDILIRNLFINGNKAGQTTKHAATYLTANASLSTVASDVAVLDTTDFPSSGVAWVGNIFVTYTAKDATHLKNCVMTAGTGAPAKGSWVTRADGQLHGIAMQAARSVIDNVWVRGPKASGIYWQGPDPQGGQGYAYENRLFAFGRVDWFGRFGLEVGENVSDSHVWGWVPGVAENLDKDPQTGAILLRSGNWSLHSIHPTGWYVPTGSFGFAPYKQAGIVIAASEIRIEDAYVDLAPGTSITIDTMISGGGELNNIHIGDARTLKGGMVSLGHGLLFRGTTATDTVKRVHLNPNFHSPVGYAVCNGPLSKMAGAQTLNALPGNKLQLMSTRDFLPTSGIGGSVFISSDTLAYTGKTEATTYVTTQAAVDAASIEVLSTADFDAAGNFVAIVPNGTSFSTMLINYTSKDATHFLGCTWTLEAGSAKAVIPAGLYGAVTQDFLTGVSGGALGSTADQTTARQTNAQPRVTALTIDVPMYRSYQYSRHNLNTASGDLYEVIGGWASEKPMNVRGQVTFNSGSGADVVVNHGLPDTPTLANIDVLGGVTDTLGRRIWPKSATTTQITFGIDAAPAANVTVNWAAKVV